MYHQIHCLNNMLLKIQAVCTLIWHDVEVVSQFSVSHLRHTIRWTGSIVKEMP